MRLFGGGSGPPQSDAGQPGLPARSRPVTGDWAAIASLQTTTGTMPRTVDTDGFQGDLAARRPLHQFLAPLSHAVSPEAPRGLAHGLTTVVQTTTQTMPGPELAFGS